jgi:voltage-gated potassium channel
MDTPSTWIGLVDGKEIRVGTSPEGTGTGPEPLDLTLLDRRIQRWELVTEVPLLLASMVFLAALAVPIIAPGIPQTARTACWTTVLVLWAVFLVDYLARLALARRRAYFLYSRSLDLAVVVLPVLRPVRAVRQLAWLNVLRERVWYGFEIQVMIYAGLGTVLLGFTAALTELQAERHAKGATIRTIGDAVWWSATEITGSGYGDMVPVTFWGRATSLAVSLASLALFGVVTGTFASWFTSWYRSSLETAAHARESSTLPELRHPPTGRGRHGSAKPPPDQPSGEGPTPPSP